MPANAELPLSVAEVFELQASTEESASWVNPGFRCVVNAIVPKTSKTGKPYWDCLLGDETNPNCQVSASFFGKPPTFKEGQIVEFIGSGMRRSEFRGNAQVSLPQKGYAIHIIGNGAAAAPKGVDFKAAASAGRAATPPPAGPPPTSRPVGTGAQPVVFGATVGMAIKEALPLIVMAWGGIVDGGCLKDPRFWSDTYDTASDIVRLARALEAGKLRPNIKDRLNPPAAAVNPEADFEPAPEPAPKPPDRSPVNPPKYTSAPPDEDVPF